jgi:hypothetical protein
MVASREDMPYKQPSDHPSSGNICEEQGHSVKIDNTLVVAYISNQRGQCPVWKVRSTDPIPSPGTEPDMQTGVTMIDDLPRNILENHQAV